MSSWNIPYSPIDGERFSGKKAEELGGDYVAVILAQAGYSLIKTKECSQHGALKKLHASPKQNKRTNQEFVAHLRQSSNQGCFSFGGLQRSPGSTTLKAHSLPREGIRYRQKDSNAQAIPLESVFTLRLSLTFIGFAIAHALPRKRQR